MPLLRCLSSGLVLLVPRAPMCAPAGAGSLFVGGTYKRLNLLLQLHQHHIPTGIPLGELTSVRRARGSL